MNDTLQVAAVVTGAALGAALLWLVWQLRPAIPALGPALQRLNPDRPQTYRSPLHHAAAWCLDAVIPASDLAVLGITRATYVSHLGIAAGIGLVAAPTLGLSAYVAGLHLSLLAPTAGGLAFSAGCLLMLDRSTRQRARAARAEYRRGVCVYLDQVALATAAGHGPVASLELAAMIGSGPVFDRIRDAITEAKLRLEPPWERLQHLGAALDVPALGDLGDIMHASGTAGAQVYKTLRAKASSVRTQVRYDEFAAAKSASTALDAIGAALVLVLLGIAVYPFIAQLQFIA